MKKILFALCIAVMTLSVASCNKFPHEGTATESLAGNWVCSIYASDGTQWVEYYEAEYMTYNTAANESTIMWIDDNQNFWGTKAKVDADADARTFGKEGAEYFDTYYEVNQKIWGGKVTEAAVTVPGSKSVCDKIEFYIQFEDDTPSYGTTYYVVGYRRTGFPEDDEAYIWDWELPAVQ